MTEKELREKIRKQLTSISIEKNNTNEAAPRMKKDKKVEQLKTVRQIASGVEAQIKTGDSSRYSHVKNDFNKFRKAIDSLISSLSRKGSTIPENVVNEGPNYDEAMFNLDKIFGDDQESIETFQGIEDNGTVEDMVDYINNYGDESRLSDYGFRNDKHVKKFAKMIMEKELNEKSRKWGDVALLIQAAWEEAKIPVSYAKDYVESLERMAKKNAKLFFKQYGDFTQDDFEEDMRYNMANESKVNEMKNPRKVFDYSKLTFSQIEKLEDLYAKFTKGKKPEEIKESVNEKKLEPIFQLAEDLDAVAHDATSDGKTSVKVQSTDKTWDDGVPVLKYIARSSKMNMKLPKKFIVVDDEKYGWWYFEVNGIWYGIDQDKYGTPPFDY